MKLILILIWMKKLNYFYFIYLLNFIIKKEKIDNIFGKSNKRVLRKMNSDDFEENIRQLHILPKDYHIIPKK